MRRWLKPDLMLPAVGDISVDLLVEHGIRALLLDADNTLVPRKRYELDAETRRVVVKGRRRLQVWEDAEPFPQTSQRNLVRIALSHEWTENPLMIPWRLPAGAFGEASGPS